MAKIPQSSFTPLSVRLKPELFADLRAQAAKSNLSMAKLVEFALIEYLGRCCPTCASPNFVAPELRAAPKRLVYQLIEEDP